MTKHIPVPYGYFKSQESRFFQSEKWAITGPDHDHEESWDIIADGIPDEATARFIVTACNSHADLLFACKSSLPWIAKVSADQPEGDPTGVGAQAMRQHARVNDEIRKAEES